MRQLRKMTGSAPVLVGILIVALSVGGASVAGAQVVLDTPELPPEPDPDRCDTIISLYAGVGVHAVFPGPIDMSDPLHKCFQNVVRSDDGSGNEIEDFDSVLEGLVDVGFGPMPFMLTGPVTTVVFGKTGTTTGTFDTEIVAMSLTGNIGGMNVEIRESPSLPSPGQTSITDLGGGQWQIDSFFDVFTEISIDGGPFMPQVNGPGHMVLMRADDPIPVESSTWGQVKASYR